MERVQLIVFCTTLVVWVGVVAGSGCQHQCNCGFQWSGDDAVEENVTLRYEVMGGLIGAFSPLALAGIGYLIVRKLNCTGHSSPFAGRKGLAQPWRERPWSSSGKVSPSGSGNQPRGSTPISLYGETEDSFIGGNPALPSKQPKSTYKNVHRNFPGNEINQWFKNVTITKY